jgi:hypothetical protein
MQVHIIKHAANARKILIMPSRLIIVRRNWDKLSHRRVNTKPPARPRVQVAGPEVVEACLGVELLPCNPKKGCAAPKACIMAGFGACWSRNALLEGGFVAKTIHNAILMYFIFENNIHRKKSMQAKLARSITVQLTCAEEFLPKGTKEVYY